MSGICRARLAEERKQWRKDHPFVRPSLSKCLQRCANRSAGVLREANESARRIYEFAGVGGWDTREATGTFTRIAFKHSENERVGKTPWEGGVYKLTMIFPEGRSCFLSMKCLWTYYVP